MCILANFARQKKYIGKGIVNTIQLEAGEMAKRGKEALRSGAKKPPPFSFELAA